MRALTVFIETIRKAVFSHDSFMIFAIASLFYRTVHGVCARDYDQEALFAWAPAEADLIAWNQRLSALYALVAYSQDGLVGFGSIDLQKSYLDHLFVHESWQRQSVGSLLCDALESKCRRPIRTEASITAKPFFEKRGYQVIAEQWVCRRGVKLKNYWMKLT